MALSPEWNALLSGELPESMAGLPSGIQILLGFCICLVVLLIYDRLMAHGKPGEWFEIHAFANAVVVLFSLPAMWQWVLDPISVVVSKSNTTDAPDLFGSGWSSPPVLFHANNHWAILMVLAVHTYHCVKFPLSAQDMFHHFVFVPIIGVYGGFWVKWGSIRNCVAFFISGFPGGVDYVNLTLVKRGICSKLYQKRIGSKINLWIRGPGIGVLLPGTCYLGIVYGEVQGWAEIAKVVFVAGFSCFNGLYYMDMAIKNYQMHLTTTALTIKHDAELKSLKDQEADYWVKKAYGTVQYSANEDFNKIVRVKSLDDISKLGTKKTS